MSDLLSPDGKLAARWYVWRASHDIFDHDTYWRVEILHPVTGLVLASRQYSSAWSQQTRQGSGANVAGCAFSPDSRRLRVALDDGSSDEIVLDGLDLDPRFDETPSYRLSWKPLPPSGAEIEIVGRTYGHPHRRLRVPPDSGKAPVRRAGFGEHPGLVSVVREDGSIETLPYGRRSWPDELEGLRLDPTGRFRGSFLTDVIGLPGDPGEPRGSLGVWDGLSGRQVALHLRAPIASYTFEPRFLLRIVGVDGQVEERSLLDLLLPFGDLQLSPDRKRLLRFCTMIDGPFGNEAKQIRWSLLEIIDAGDARTLQKILVVAPLARRERETITVSDFRQIPEGPTLASPRGLIAARFADPVAGRDLLRVTLENGEETDLRLGQ